VKCFSAIDFNSNVTVGSNRTRGTSRTVRSGARS